VPRHLKSLLQIKCTRRYYEVFLIMELVLRKIPMLSKDLGFERWQVLVVDIGDNSVLGVAQHP
jgi:hypothetical protein